MSDGTRPIPLGIELVDGQHFAIMEPDPETISPETIAHSLSNLCRFTGHCMSFYSVAQHCVMVSRLVPAELAMAGLLHDASEAFIGDLSSPLKAVLDRVAPGVIRTLEDRIHVAIGERFELKPPQSVHRPEVKHADLTALSTEKRDLMSASIADWPGLPPPVEDPIFPLRPERARRQWLRRYISLGGTF